MRSRNLKPEIFTNELLAIADPLYTIIFEGLWCMADRAGRLEDRPAKIHMKVNPGRGFESTERSLAWLTDNEFIHRYCIGKDRYIQVINFSKHQNPHQKEAASKIPKPGASPVLESEKPCATLELGSDQEAMDGTEARLIPSSLTPDSGLLIPESSPPERSSPRRSLQAVITELPEFLGFKVAYPSRAGSQEWRKAMQRATAWLAKGYTWDQMIAGAQRYAEYIRSTGSEGTQYVKQASVFLGPELHFLEEWTPPREKVDTTPKNKFARAMEALDRA